MGEAVPQVPDIGSLAFDVEEVLSKLTLQEKISLISGRDFWHSYGIERLGIPSIRMSDGPNGVRGTKFTDGVPSACLPCGTYGRFLAPPSQR